MAKVKQAALKSGKSLRAFVADVLKQAVAK
jgi:predicted HicB family RNase H-like nuclease